jgi:hypothetical protein
MSHAAPVAAAKAPSRAGGRADDGPTSAIVDILGITAIIGIVGVVGIPGVAGFPKAGGATRRRTR